MAQYFQIKASPKLIEQAASLFNATLQDIITELLQNSRRAAASLVKISLTTKQDQPWLMFSDDGSGIFRDGVDITLGESHWCEAIQNREYPAGMGIFSLAHRGCTIEANQTYISLHPDHFNGKELVQILRADYDSGTRIGFPVFEDEIKTIEQTLSSCCQYYPVPVLWQGKELPRQDFLANAVYTEEWRGLQIGVFDGFPLSRCHVGTTTFNFYSLGVYTTLPALNHCLVDTYRNSLWVAINVLNAPELRLTLPSRKNVIHNDFYKQLQSHVITVMYHYIAQLDKHYLPFGEYQRAGHIGIALPPAHPQLPKYQPATANDGTEPRETDLIALDDAHNYLIVAFEEEPAIEQVFYRCFQQAHPDTILLAEQPAMAGYAWYDAIAYVTDARMNVHYPDQSYSLEEVPLEKVKERPASITITVEILTQDTRSELTFAADIALWEDKTSISCSDLSSISCLVPYRSTIAVDELAQLLFECDSFLVKSPRV